MPIFEIPERLASQFKTDREISVEGTSLESAFASLEKIAPGLVKAVIADDGSIQRFVRLAIDGKMMPSSSAHGMALKPASVVKILMGLAGG